MVTFRDPESPTEPDGLDPAAMCAERDCASAARQMIDGRLVCNDHAGREFSSERAAAVLTAVEEGALRCLASLGYNPSVADLAEFCSGFAPREVSEQETRVALFSLDVLGWAAPVPADRPQEAGAWRITKQGRIALEHRC